MVLERSRRRACEAGGHEAGDDCSNAVGALWVGKPPPLLVLKHALVKSQDRGVPVLLHAVAEPAEEVDIIQIVMPTFLQAPNLFSSCAGHDINMRVEPTHGTRAL